MADKDKRPAEEKAVADAVATALDKLGPLATATLLENQIAVVRRVERSAEYPKALYGKNGETRIVQSKAEEADAKGFSTTPSDDHRAAQSSGAVAENQTRVEAEVAVRRAKYLADPTDSTAHSAVQGSGVIVGHDATMDVPPVAQAVSHAADAAPQPAAAPVAAPVQPKPAPAPAPTGTPKGDVK